MFLCARVEKHIENSDEMDKQVSIFNGIFKIHEFWQENAPLAIQVLFRSEV